MKSPSICINLVTSTLIHKDIIILNLYSENIFDIEAIFRKVESFPGVKKAEVF